MEYKDSSVLSCFDLNIDSTEILKEVSDDCTRVVDFMLKMTGSHWSTCVAPCIRVESVTGFFSGFVSKNDQPNEMKDSLVSHSLRTKALSMCLNL